MELDRKDDAQECGRSEEAGRADGLVLVLAAGQDHRGYRETFGQLVQEDRKKKQDTQPGGDQEPGADSDAIKECVDRQAKQDGRTDVVVADLFGVGLFAKMKMLGEDVLEKMHQEKTAQYVEESVLARKRYRFGDDFDQRDGEHVSSAQGEEILQIFARPFAINDKVSTEEIASCSDYAENGREEDARC